MKVVTLTILLSLISCATQTPNAPRAKDIKSAYVENDGSEIIELQNPYQQGIIEEIETPKKVTAHTVYDSQENIEKFKNQKKQKTIENISKFKFYHVKENESLSSIAKNLYGDWRRWKTLHSWNYDVLPNENNIEKGMKLKYLPLETVIALEKKKLNRIPASRK